MSSFSNTAAWVVDSTVVASSAEELGWAVLGLVSSVGEAMVVSATSAGVWAIFWRLPKRLPIKPVTLGSSPFNDSSGSIS